MGSLHFNVAKLVKAVAVRGDSMSPNFNEGDWLLFRLLPDGAKKKVKVSRLTGKVVLIQRQSNAGNDFLQIKRVSQIVSNSKFKNEIEVWVEGDNSEKSTDSRSWGTLETSEVIGVLIFRYRRARN